MRSPMTILLQPTGKSTRHQGVLFDLDQFGWPLGRFAHDLHALAKAWRWPFWQRQLCCS